MRISVSRHNWKRLDVHGERPSVPAFNEPGPGDKGAGAMATATQQKSQHPSLLTRLKERFNPLLRFWTKVSNDWMFNLSGLLAYNFLMSIFPILLALLAIAGFVLNTISPGSQQQLTDAIANALPGGASGTGGVVVKVALNNLQREAGVLFIIGVITAIFTGSRLFVTMENCFGVIFRLRGRNLIHQNIMAIGMLLLYIVLVPIMFLASIVPSAILNTLHAGGATTGFGGFLFQVAGLAASFVVALILFAAIYIVVPNRPVRFYEVWKGTLVAAALLVLYELLFPIYESLALKPNSYGSVAGFAIVILAFFYYLAVILLLGAEINSWASGQRETASDIAAIMHVVQAHNTTRGGAGPTAGEPQEDLEGGQGAKAMATLPKAKAHSQTDHRDDTRPTTFQPGSAARDGGKSDKDVSRITSSSDGRGGRDSGERIRATSNLGSDGAAHSTSDGTRAAPYAHHVPVTQPHVAVRQGTRDERRADEANGLDHPLPGARPRERNTERTLGIALAIGVAAAAFWLERRK